MYKFVFMYREFDDAPADEWRDMHNFDVDTCVICARFCL